MDNRRILVLGGYGNFGKRITAILAQNPEIHLVIAGRSREKAGALCRQTRARQPNANIESLAIDIHSNQFSAALKAVNPFLVIHTSGPFQGQDYSVPQACIEAGTHYIDLADGRRFVCDIEKLSAAAKSNNVLVISGASTVPGLASVVADYFYAEFSQLDSIDYGISPGNKVNPGVATVGAILTQAGQPITCWRDGRWQTLYGWSDPRCYDFGGPVGKRWLANIDIPDLELFPKRYRGVKTIRFQAGHELPLIHHTLVLMGKFARCGLVNNWARYTRPVYQLGRLLHVLGTDTGGMFMALRGKDKNNKYLEIHWTLIAENGVGPNIPVIPAILVAQKLVDRKIDICGAVPCLGMFTLEEFTAMVKPYGIYHTTERKSG